jgi:hypothetical protein
MGGNANQMSCRKTKFKQADQWSLLAFRFLTIILSSEASGRNQGTLRWLERLAALLWLETKDLAGS